MCAALDGRREQKVYDFQELAKSHQIAVTEVPAGSRVLELGCATGYVSRYLKEELGCRVVGVEISPEAARRAEPYCERLIVGDLSGEEVWKEIVPPFDVVLANDVLEHLPEPDAVVGRCRDLLRVGGRMIVSVPNVAYWRVRFGLLFGRFDYTDKGILDDTHLRFFTARTGRSLLEDQGLRVVRFSPIFGTAPGYEAMHWLHLGIFRRAYNWVVQRIWPGGCAFQYLLVAIRE